MASTISMNLEDTAFQEQAIAQWRDWRRYLSLHLRLLDLRASGTAEHAAPFELSNDADPEQEIRQQLAAIPTDVRAVFERAVDDRQQQERRRLDAERRERGDRHAQPSDADEVDRAAFIALLDDADGHSKDGIGVVPMADGWYEVDAELLGAVPDEARYRLRGGPQALGVGRIAAIVGIVGVGAGLIWMSMPRSELVSAPATTILVNDLVSTGWTPRSVTFSTAIDHTMPIVARGASGSDDLTSWYEPDSWPLAVCAPQSLIDQGIQRVQVISVGDAPIRTFTLSDDALTTPDIVVASCDGQGPLRYGMLSAAVPQPAVRIGQMVTLSDNQTITLTSLATVGPGENPQLPQGKAQLVATVTTNTAVDWSKLNAVIRWPDGQDILPSESIPQQGSVVFRYLVPLTTHPIERVQWRVIDPRTGVDVRWEGPLSAPLLRAEVIAQALTQVRVDAERLPAGALQLHLSLLNSAATPLLVTEGDIIVTQDGRRLPLPALAALREPLASGEMRVVDMAISLSAAQPVIVSVGAVAYTIGP